MTKPRIVLAAAIGAGLLIGQPAMAAGSPVTSAGPDSDRPSIASEEESAPDFTAQQRAKLDIRAEETLRNSKAGARRIAPDKIAWDGGDVVLTLAVGDQHRRANLRKPNGLVHLYEAPYYQGDRLSFYTCGKHKLRHYNFTNTTASTVNNQYGGERAQLYRWKNEEWDLIHRSWAVSKYPLFSNELTNTADMVKLC